jgi:hypothetical protein
MTVALAHHDAAFNVGLGGTVDSLAKSTDREAAFTFSKTEPAKKIASAWDQGAQTTLDRLTLQVETDTNLRLYATPFDGALKAAAGAAAAVFPDRSVDNPTTVTEFDRIFRNEATGAAHVTCGAERLTQSVITLMLQQATAAGARKFPLTNEMIFALRRYIKVTAWKRHAIGIATNKEMPGPPAGGFWIYAFRAQAATEFRANSDADKTAWETARKAPMTQRGLYNLKCVI